MFDKRHSCCDERVVFVDKVFVTHSIYSSYSAGCKVLGAEQSEATISRQRKGCMVQVSQSAGE